MTTRERLKQERIQDALRQLAPNPLFAVYIEALRDIKEESVDFMIEHTTAKDERDYLAAVGEVRAYKRIIAVYEDLRTTIELQAEQASSEG